jgi:hypothetical protein
MLLHSLKNVWTFSGLHSDSVGITTYTGESKQICVFSQREVFGKVFFFNWWWIQCTVGRYTREWLTNKHLTFSLALYCCALENVCSCLFLPWIPCPCPCQCQFSCSYDVHVNKYIRACSVLYMFICFVLFSGSCSCRYDFVRISKRLQYTEQRSVLDSLYSLQLIITGFRRMRFSPYIQGK